MPKSTAESVLLEILRQADGEWTGKTRLFKAFYFAHLFYGLQRPGLLTDWPIVRMPQGPGIDNSDELFTRLIEGGLLTSEMVHGEGPYSEYRYRLTDQGLRALPVPDDAARAIEKSVLFCKDKSSGQLSQLTHDHSRSWIEGKDGDILDIDIDLISEEEYAKRQAELTRMEATLAGIFQEMPV